MGHPLEVRVSGGERHDITQALTLLEGYCAEAVLVDKADDARSLIEWLKEQGIEAVISPRKNHQQCREYDAHRYGERHFVECFFNKLKRFRRIFTRYNKWLRNYLSSVYSRDDAHLPQVKRQHILVNLIAKAIARSVHS